MNAGNSLIICLRSGGGFDMGDQMWRVIIASFGQMHFVTHPLSLPLLGKKGFWIIGRVDQCPGSWSIGEIAPVQVSFLPIKILDPDASQRLDCRNLTQPDGSPLSIKSI